MLIRNFLSVAACTLVTVGVSSKVYSECNNKTVKTPPVHSTGQEGLVTGPCKIKVFQVEYESTCTFSYTEYTQDIFICDSVAAQGSYCHDKVGDVDIVVANKGGCASAPTTADELKKLVDFPCKKITETPSKRKTADYGDCPTGA